MDSSRNNCIKQKIDQGKVDERTFANILLRHGTDHRVKWMYTDKLFMDTGMKKRDAYRTPDLTFYVELDDGTIDPLMFIEVEHATDYSMQVGFKVLNGNFFEHGYVTPHFFVPNYQHPPMGKHFPSNGLNTGHTHMYLHKKNYFDVKQVQDFNDNVMRLFDISDCHTFYARISKDWSHVFFVRSDDFLNVITDPDSICVKHGNKRNDKPYIIHNRGMTFFTYCPKRRFQSVNMSDYVSSNYKSNQYPIWNYVLQYLSCEIKHNLVDLYGNWRDFKDAVNYFRDRMLFLSADNVVTRTIRNKPFKVWLVDEWRRINESMADTIRSRQIIARDNMNFIRDKDRKSSDLY